MYFIFWYDYVVLPFYLLLFIILLNRWFHKKHGHNRALKKHFNRALAIKLLGCIALGLIYEYYYDGSYDGRFYFDGGKMLRNYWLDYPSEFFHVLFSDLKDFNATNLAGLKGSSATIFADPSFTVAKFAGIFNLLSFNTFFPCSLCFCLIAFMALWNFFIFLITEFKLDMRLAALCTLYIPSVLIWDSGVFKDTVTFSCLLWAFMCGYYAFVRPRKVLKNILGLTLCIVLILSIKVYILAAFAPVFILFIFNYHKGRIKNQTIKFLATPFILLISIGSIVIFLMNANELLGQYSVDQVLETASRTYNDISTGGGQAGSAYSMDVDLSSPGGVALAIPAGINVTLFRPYPWEHLKPFTLLASAESMILLYFTFLVFYRAGIRKVFRNIWTNPFVQFCFIFSLLFAFMVGISSSNFGTLVRYKIPCLPFYCLFLAFSYQLSSAKSKKFKRKILLANNV